MIRIQRGNQQGDDIADKQEIYASRSSARKKLAAIERLGIQIPEALRLFLTEPFSNFS